ncbi:MAG: alternative ribosome rescue aminoacyl-tRNA hydrolase ArfB [Pirellulaceae bacterium]|jgi:ribosome-associated protein|nr:alternative ribosome rescue aminoacyl-tRNA hydrolase ArfB [Pirellulaceae bacterium]MDP7018950.1 alternative ribosome rescue aminoacyl-tRNA hydrolase ArfB [Pirellulaceae bacterium]
MTEATADFQRDDSSDRLVVNRRLSVPIAELVFTYSRSSGPGGQNVNKVNTRVQVRWNVLESESVPDDVRSRFVQRYHNRITRDGHLILASQRTRNQADNVRDCLDKLRDLLVAVAEPPKPRKKTKPSRASRERRLRAKRRQSAKKQNRRRPAMDD